MFRPTIVAITAAGALALTPASNAFAAAKCTSVQARCAIEVGGRCNPVTGRWEVHQHGAGGTVNAFIACLDRVRRK